jgi:hypothetical protein
MFDTIDNTLMKIVVGVSPKKRNDLLCLFMACFGAGSALLSSGWIFSKNSETIHIVMKFHSRIVEAIALLRIKV